MNILHKMSCHRWLHYSAVSIFRVSKYTVCGFAFSNIPQVHLFQFVWTFFACFSCNSVTLVNNKANKCSSCEEFQSRTPLTLLTLSLCRYYRCRVHKSVISRYSSTGNGILSGNERRLPLTGKPPKMGRCRSVRVQAAPKDSWQSDLPRSGV